MSEFEDRIRDAIARGQKRGEQASAKAQQKELGAEELKALHSKYRLALSATLNNGENCIYIEKQYLGNIYKDFSKF